jgi:lipid-binding SYLF domain-containing protein
MSRYAEVAFRWLFVAVITSMIALEPRVNAIQATTNQPNRMAQNAEQAVIRKTVQQELGQSPLFKINKIVVASDYALVGWLQGEAGGEVLLRKTSGTWKILAHSGGWYGLKGLKELGVPEAIAEQLLTGTDPKWRDYE